MLPILKIPGALQSKKFSKATLTCLLFQNLTFLQIQCLAGLGKNARYSYWHVSFVERVD